MKVSGKNISMTRGDSEAISLSCTDSSKVGIPLVTGDTIYFTVKVSASDEAKAFQKVVTAFDAGIAYIDIMPNDTKSMCFGSYVYDVQLTKANGTVTTIIPPSRFTLLEEVTYE
jgi:hypothetical protein